MLGCMSPTIQYPFPSDLYRLGNVVQLVITPVFIIYSLLVITMCLYFYFHDKRVTTERLNLDMSFLNEDIEYYRRTLQALESIQSKLDEIKGWAQTNPELVSGNITYLLNELEAHVCDMNDILRRPLDPKRLGLYNQ